MTEPEFHEETPEEFARQPDRDLHGVPTQASGESDSGSDATEDDARRRSAEREDTEEESGD
ncbi:hypothetical protein [Hamadaea tsunoensis]|uniref:hypothetical protein n=1 Tax=Hamadaea tsunoensis TaxID=53368 RepID=UPI0012FAF8B2|nr:hypothetical protein [Hamadaea tsunoensis]